MNRIDSRLRGRLWRASWILLAAWFVVAVARWIMNPPGHLGLAQVLGAGICVLGMTVFSGWMFYHLARVAIGFWVDRWKWVTRRGKAPVSGVMELIVMIIMEVFIYYFAFLTGYGVVLGAYVLGSLAWTGNVTLSVQNNLIIFW